jgi:hypothetical protein
VNLRELAGPDLRDAWVEELAQAGSLTCDEIRSRLRARGLKAKGIDRKAEIRNIHSAANADPRIEKREPGVFGLVRGPA